MKFIEETQSHYLAIDFGMKRIGLALSDPTKIFSYAFKTILNNNQTDFILEKIITEKKVEKIILGNPLKEDGALTEFSQNILLFKHRLEKIFKGEIILWEENFSSEIAKEIIIKSVTKKKKRKQKELIDQNAAAVILQEYLDSYKN